MADLLRGLGAGAVFEQVVIKPAGKGRRFSPDRVYLFPC